MFPVAGEHTCLHVRPTIPVSHNAWTKLPWSASALCGTGKASVRLMGVLWWLA